MCPSVILNPFSQFLWRNRELKCYIFHEHRQIDRRKKQFVISEYLLLNEKVTSTVRKKEERQNLHGSEALCSLQLVGKASTGICTSLYPELNSRRRYKSTSSHTPIILPLESLPLGAAGCLCGFSSPQSPLSVFMQT